MCGLDLDRDSLTWHVWLLNSDEPQQFPGSFYGYIELKSQHLLVSRSSNYDIANHLNKRRLSRNLGCNHITPTGAFDRVCFMAGSKIRLEPCGEETIPTSLPSIIGDINGSWSTRMKAQMLLCVKNVILYFISLRLWSGSVSFVCAL